MLWSGAVWTNLTNQSTASGGEGNQRSQCLQCKYGQFIYYQKPPENVHVSLIWNADDGKIVVSIGQISFLGDYFDLEHTSDILPP